MNKTMGLMQKGIALDAPTLLNLISLVRGKSFNFGLFEAAKATPTASQIHDAAPQFKLSSGGLGGRRRDAGERGLCKNYDLLTALVSSIKNATKEFVRGLTTVEHPTFWFYIPNAEIPIEFLLQDENKNDVYRTRLQARQNSSGIVSVPIPATAPPLCVNQYYRWLLAISCDPGDAFGQMLVRGEIQRIEISSEAQKSLNAAQMLLDKAILYANNSIWFDALTTLGEKMQQGDLKDMAISTVWADLLKQGNLADLVTALVLSCYNPK